jgi:hypothetical protein
MEGSGWEKRRGGRSFLMGSGNNNFLWEAAQAPRAGKYDGRCRLLGELTTFGTSLLLSRDKLLSDCEIEIVGGLELIYTQDQDVYRKIKR